jgi:hypothetical protein
MVDKERCIYGKCKYYDDNYYDSCCAHLVCSRDIEDKDKIIQELKEKLKTIQMVIDSVLKEEEEV